MNEKQKQHYAEMKAIHEGEGSDLEKVLRAYDLVTRSYMQEIAHELEVQRALGDTQAAIKEQIKLGVMQSARGMMEYCHRYMTGKGAWHE
jgi:hypothetical protein